MTSYAVEGTGPEAYERYLVPALFAPLADAMLAAVRPVGGRRVLDVACGTGIVARRAATAAGEATGVDVNPAMLAVAGRIAPGIRWTRGDATALPFPDASFDVVFCQQGLQFVPDRHRALRTLSRSAATSKSGLG